MTTFDKLFFHLFQHYKAKKSKKANGIATCYITVLQCSLLFLLGVFSAKFFSRMNVETMSTTKAWTLFIMATIFIYFKNWMQYSGKRRNIINAKMLKKKKLTYNIWWLWFLPLVILSLSFVLFQAT